jgi:hypothetical protein
MPKTLEVFKKEFDAIKKEFDACDEETDNSGHLRGHHDAMIEQGARAVGERVRALRQAGKAGASLDDFKDDPEVKRALAEIELHVTGIDTEMARLRTLSAGPWRKTLTRYTTLEKDLVTEIAARKKELSTKAGLGNKSLPEMEKMLVAVKNPNDMYKQFKNMRDYTTNTPSYQDPTKHRKERDRYLAVELAKSKDKALSEAQAELFERLLVDRNFNKYTNRVRALSEGIQKAVVDGKAALAARDSAALTSAQASGSKQLKELEDIVTQYGQARQTIGDAAIVNGKGGDKVMTGLKNMVIRRDKAIAEFAPVSKAKVTR